MDSKDNPTERHMIIKAEPIDGDIIKKVPEEYFVVAGIVDSMENEGKMNKEEDQEESLFQVRKLKGYLLKKLNLI